MNRRSYSRSIDRIKWDIDFQKRNLTLFAKWPRTVADSQRLLAQYETELQEALYPLALPKETELDEVPA